MINEDVLGRRFRFGESCGDHRISPLAPQYQCLRTIPFISFRARWCTRTQKRVSDRKRDQLTRRLSTYHAKQRQCLNG